MKKMLPIKYLIIFVIIFNTSCTTRTNSDISKNHTDDEGYDKNLQNNNYDWTGTYELKDNDILYTLKLHKRSVDASYEMQFYDNTNKTELYKSSIYDAKDDSSNIYIKFLNNFNMDATPLGFKSGDTLFVLKHINSKEILTFFKAFKPKSNVMFDRISNTYN